MQRALIEETSKLPMAMMQVAPEQGAFMTVLTRIVAEQRRHGWHAEVSSELRSATGSANQKVAPSPSALSTPTRPPSC